MWYWIQANIISIIAFLALIVALVSLAFSAWRYNKIRLEELKQKRFTNYHDLIFKLVAGQSEEKFPRLDCQVAIIYELRNYPEYREVTIRILEGLCPYWTKLTESDKETEYARLLNEIPLTLSQLQEDDSIIKRKKGIERIVWVLSVIGGVFTAYPICTTHGWYFEQTFGVLLGVPLSLLVGIAPGFLTLWFAYWSVCWIVKGFESQGKLVSGIKAKPQNINKNNK